MTLLAPGLAVIAGAIGFPLLTVLYLLKLRRRPLTISSTMLWEQAAQDVQVNVPLRWIRPSVLFLLHALILLLFVLALGRPAIEAAGVTSAKAIFLIDRSASMQARDGEGGATRLAEAKSEALERGRRLFRNPGRPVITLISFANDALIASRPLDSVDQLKHALDEIEAVDQPGRLGPALQLAQTLIGSSSDEDEQQAMPLVAVFSDGEFVDDAPLAIAGARVGLSPVKVRAEVDAGNLSIVACSATRDEERPAAVRLFVRVQSTFRRDMAVSVSVLVNGELVQTHAVVVPAATGEKPGEIGQSFALESTDNVLLTATINRSDLLEADNTANVYLRQPLRARVLLVHPDDEPSNSFLKDTLAEMPIASVREMSASGYEQFASERTELVNLIVFDRVWPQSLPSVPTLSFGAWAGNIQTRAAPAGDAGFVLTWDRNASLLRHVSLDTLEIGPLAPLADEHSLAKIGRVTELANVRDGPVITLVESDSAEHVFVGFSLGASNWPLNFSFPLFMFNAVEEMTGSAASRTSISFTTTEPVIVRAMRRADTIRLTGERELTIERTSAEPGLTSLGVIEKAGVYRSDAISPPMVAVNMFSPKESELGVSEDLVVGGEDVLRLDESVGRREIWQWLVVAATLLLVLEWLIYAMRVRL